MDGGDGGDTVDDGYGVGDGDGDGVLAMMWMWMANMSLVTSMMIVLL